MNWDIGTSDVSARRGDLASKLVLGVVLLVALSLVVGSWLSTRPVGGEGASKATHIPWVQHPQSALAQAQEQGKPLLVRFVAPWCGVCAKMEREAFSDATVIAAVDKGFVPLSVDITWPSNGPFAGRYQVDALPTLLVLKPDGQEVARSVGLMAADELLQWLEQPPAPPNPPASTGGVAG